MGTRVSVLEPWMLSGALPALGGWGAAGAFGASFFASACFGASGAGAYGLASS